MASFTPAGDMWGLGIVLFSLLSSGKLPFGETGVCCEGETRTLDSVQHRLHRHLLCEVDDVNQFSSVHAAGNMTQEEIEMRAIGFDPEAKSLLLGLLCADPAQRFTAADVLAHSWVAEAAPLVPQLPEQEQFQVSGKTISLQQQQEESTPSPSQLQRCMDGPTSMQSLQSSQAPQPTNTVAATAAVMAAAMAATQQKQQEHPAAVIDFSAPECPYPIIGHVAQPLEVTIDGQSVTVSALHAVYAVPGHGAMMSAAPVAVADPAEVKAAAAAAADGNSMAPMLSQLLNQGALPGHHQL